MGLHHTTGPIRSYEKRMIDANKAYWQGRKKITSKEKWIYCFHTQAKELEQAILEEIVAKRIQETDNLPVAAVSYGECSCKLFDEMDTSFGFEEISGLFPDEYCSLASRFQTYVAAKYWSSATYRKKEKLFQIKYRGILCGESIYDEIIRQNKDYVFDCFDIGKEAYENYLRMAFSLVDQSYKMFRKRKPAYIVTTEHPFFQGLFVCAASRLGAEYISLWNATPEYPIRVLPSADLYNKAKSADLIRKRIESYISEHPHEEVKEEDVFLYNFDEARQDDWCEKLGIVNGRKNVFIMLHGLSDAPRSSCQHYVYTEYNDWFLGTIELIKKIPGVNWIIRDHPHAEAYRQDRYVRRIFEENKTDNMYWCGKEISGMQIKEAADCIITCTGDVGIEYWSYGIPTITTGEAYYCKWGISYNMKSLEEYEETLRHIDQIKPPSPQSIAEAKKYMMAYREMRKGCDELGKLFSKRLVDQVKDLMCSDIEDIFFRLRHGFCKHYIQLLDKDAVRNSITYEKERQFDL